MAQAHLIKESQWLNGIRDGVTISEMFSIPPAEVLSPGDAAR
jgi:hypothetical protein